jgi:hypothetical protein
VHHQTQTFGKDMDPGATGAHNNNPRGEHARDISCTQQVAAGWDQGMQCNAHDLITLQTKPMSISCRREPNTFLEF